MTMRIDGWLEADFTEAHGKELCTWQYTGECAIYNYSPWEDCVRFGYDVASPEGRALYHALLSGGTLVGFFRLELEPLGLMVGLGLRPDLCDQGLGRELMVLIEGYAKVHFPGAPLLLEVRTFNQRAKRCYERAGFVTVEEYVRDTPTGPGEFYLMKCQCSGFCQETV